MQRWFEKAGRGIVSVFGLTVLVSTARADAPRIALGEVSLPAARNDARLRELFRGAVSTELGRVKVDASDDQYVLSASLLKWSTSQREQTTFADCVVSATLRSTKQGGLVAIVRGRGRVELGRDLEGDRIHALRAAVRGAIRRVPEALPH